MTFNILFFSITISKRNYTQEEMNRELEIQKITDEIIDRKCSVRHFM
jgi:uncharacterized protein (TIGR02413 family)